MYNPQELQRKAQLNIHGVDTNAQTSLNNNNPPKQESEQNWFVRGLATIGNFVNNIVMGAVKSIEGIVDAGAMLVGLFGADVDDFVSYDFTADIFGADEEGEGLLEWSWGRNLADVSYLDNDHIVNQIADGVGGMLPTVALAFVSGGTSLAGTAASAGAKAASIGAKVANVASKVAFVAGAAGNASESALQEGATYGQALGYGALSGAIEAGTEMIGGRVFGSATKLDNTLLGKLAVKTGTDKFISKGAGKAVYSFASEGLEEVVADLLDPVNKRITGVDSEAKVDWAQLPKTFFIGGAVGSILDGVQSGASALIHKDKGGKHFVNVAESLEDIANSIQSLAVIQEDSNITQEQVDGATVRNAERNLDSLENMSNEFKEMTEEERTEALATLQESSPSIADMFEPNGDLKEEVYATLQEIINSGKSSNVSANLTYNVKEVKDTLATVNKSHGYNIELSDTTFTPEQRTNFAKISKAVSGLGRKSGVGLNLAIIKTNKYANAFIEGNTMYVSEEHLADGTWVKQVAHEVSHFTENTREFKHFAEFITEDVEAVNRAVAKIVKATDYGFTEADIRSALNKIKQGLKLTAKELSGYQELVAHVTEELLGNEASIERLSRNNTGLARKIYNKIRDILTAIKGTNAEKATVERLKKAEKLFARSLTAVGSELGEFRTSAGRAMAKYKADREEYLALSEDKRAEWLKDKGYTAEDFADDVLDDGNELDNSGEIRYSYKARDPKTVTEKEFKHHYWAVANNLLSKEELGVLNSAIGNISRGEVYEKNADGLYMIPVGKNQVYNKVVFTNGKQSSYSVDYIVEIHCKKESNLDNALGLLYEQEKNGIPTKTTNLFKIHYSKDFRFSDFRASLGKSSENSGRKQDGARSDREVKFSIKDSAGTSLSLSQREFFKDSKILDENGNLLVMYHGTGENFTIFDLEKTGSSNDRTSHLGFWFTPKKSTAEYFAEFNSNEYLGKKGRVRKVYLNITNPKIYEPADNSSKIKALEDKNEDIKKENAGYRKRMSEIVDRFYYSMYFDDGYSLFNNAEHDLGYRVDEEYYVKMFKMTEEQAKEVYSLTRKVLENKKIIEKNNTEIGRLEDGDSFMQMADDLDEFMEWINPSHNHERGYGRENYVSTNAREAAEKFRNKLIKQGYDGIWVKNTRMDESGDQIVAFYPEQIKLTTNKKPTENPDIRFSLKDSQDRTLTEAQIEYFKDSKVRDEQGRLIVLYHGSKTDVNEFSKEFISGWNMFGKGYYFTSSKRRAQGYAKGSLKETYLNLTNPFFANKREHLDKIYPEINNTREDIEEYSKEHEIGGREFFKICNYLDDIGVDVSKILKDLGYDGVYYEGYEDIEVVAYESNQIKLTTNTNPTTSSDIRFSLKDTATYTLSDGQVKKKVANFTKLKVYSKVEAESIINSILETNFNLEDYSVRISGKTKAEAIDVLWKTLNTADAGKRTGISLKIADYIIDNTIIESIYLEEENQIYTETISFLKPYLHSVDLKALKGEIKYRYDTDNSVYLLWGKRKGEDGQTADQIAMELAESGFFIDAENEADIFFEMDRAYREAVRALKKKSDKFLADTLGKEERDKLRQDIAKDILRAFDSNGKKSKLAEIIEQQKERAKVWKDLYYEEKQRNSAINNLLYEVGKIRDIHFGDFQNSTQSHNLLFRGSIERLSAIKHRGDLNKSGTRSIVAGLNEWYSKDNPVVSDRFIEDISYILNKISSGTGKLTAEEIKGLATVVAYFRHFIETNNKIFRAGKYVDAKPIVEDYIKKIAETQNLKISWAGKVFDKLFNNSKLNYMQTFNDPMTIARYMDKYGDGFFTQTLESFREGAVNSAILEMELNASVEEFYDKHKKFLKNLKAKTVKYNNVEIPADKALYLYMALNREQALMGLARSGFSYKDDKGKTVRVAGFETNEDLTLDDIKIIASEVQSELEKQFTEEEIEYIKIAEKLFNEDCKKLKSERDKTRLGYSNVVDDYYIPIRRAYIPQSVDVDSLQFELDRVSNLSFNKSAVKGAKNELFIESLDLVLSRHLRGIAQYYHLSNVIDNFNIIYNMDIGGNANRVKSIASESVNVWDKGKTYLQDLISDIQGIKRGEGSRAFGFIRGSYAKYQLGANPKVWFTQLSSFFASTSILDYGSVIKGLAIKTNDVDKYCSLAKLRNNDNTAALAQGVLDKVDKVSNVLMKPIGMTDRLVVKKLFGACQVQVQKNTGLKIGTEENKVKAGELLQKVILETQQNTMATERSQAMRSSSELMKTLTMFTSDSMKVVGRVIDSYGELSILKARRKATTDASEKANLDKQIKTARKKAAKSTSALVTSAIFMALIAQAFRTLYNKDDEEDNIVENMTVDAVGNLFGGLPIFKDVYAKLVEGYDFDGYQYSAINDLLDSMSDVINLTGDIFSGNADSRDIALNIKKMSYAIGQLFGIPVRNVYNVFYGLTNRISPATAYKIDDIFYKQSYNSDLKKAIKNNDEAMIATIAGLIMNENVGDFENGSTRSEVNRLLSAGFDVLPQSVPSSVTINEVQHSLNGPQQEKFRKAYSGAITAVDKLVSSNGYKIATDEAKAKAIKYVYRYYYYEAQHQALNVDLDSKLYLFGQIVPIEKMALALAEVPLLVENSTNKKTAVQRYLQASKLTSAQKYMLMGYFGYKNTKGEGVVKSAINKTSLTKEQKKLLLEKCGY